MSYKYKKFCIATVISVIFIYIQPFRLKVIDSAEIGIKFHRWSSDNNKKGGVEGTCKGLIIYNRYTEAIFTYPTYIQRKTYESFSVTAKDASVFTMDPQIAYRIDESKACDIFVKYRKDIKDLENGYIRTCIYEAYRTCANEYNSDFLMSNRAKFEDSVRQRLEKSLLNDGFIVTEFTSAITPPDSLARMINEKNEAVQAALKAKNQVEEAKANAEIKIAKARGDAESLKITADAESYYNITVGNSLKDSVIKKRWIEKWDGHLPKTIAGENSTFYIPAN